MELLHGVALQACGVKLSEQSVSRGRTTSQSLLRVPHYYCPRCPALARSPRPDAARAGCRRRGRAAPAARRAGGRSTRVCCAPGKRSTQNKRTRAAAAKSCLPRACTHTQGQPHAVSPHALARCARRRHGRGRATWLPAWLQASAVKLGSTGVGMARRSGLADRSPPASAMIPLPLPVSPALPSRCPASAKAACFQSEECPSLVSYALCPAGHTYEPSPVIDETEGHECRGQ